MHNAEDNPCYGCTERHVEKGYNCHSDCPRFIKASEKNKEKNAMIRKQKADEAMFTEVRIRSIEKATKEKMKRNVWKG